MAGINIAIEDVKIDFIPDEAYEKIARKLLILKKNRFQLPYTIFPRAGKTVVLNNMYGNRLKVKYAGKLDEMFVGEPGHVVKYKRLASIDASKKAIVDVYHTIVIYGGSWNYYVPIGEEFDAFSGKSTSVKKPNTHYLINWDSRMMISFPEGYFVCTGDRLNPMKIESALRAVMLDYITFMYFGSKGREELSSNDVLIKKLADDLKYVAQKIAGTDNACFVY